MSFTGQRNIKEIVLGSDRSWTRHTRTAIRDPAAAVLQQAKLLANIKRQYWPISSDNSVVAIRTTLRWVFFALLFVEALRGSCRSSCRSASRILAKTLVCFALHLSNAIGN
jgi:hypothetical protein